MSILMAIHKWVKVMPRMPLAPAVSDETLKHALLLITQFT